MKCWHENCKVCKDEGYWHYLFGVTWEHFKEVFDWENLLGSILVCGFLFLAISSILGSVWWGLLAFIPIIFISKDIDGGWGTWFLIDRDEE